MKRFLSLLMAVMLVAGLATCALASSGYVRSPGSAGLPGTITVTSEDPDYPAVIIDTVVTDGVEVVYIEDKDKCYDELIVTPYSRKDGMPGVVAHGGDEYTKIAKQSQKDLETAYDEVMAIKNRGGLLTELPGVDENFVSDLEAAARAAGTTVPNIYVSDLFDVTYYECIDDTAGPGNQPTEHNEQDEVNDEHARIYKINVEDFILRNFVALLHRPSDENGKWEVVDAEVDTVNNTIAFKVNVIARHTDHYDYNPENPEVNLSPFAIVVKKSAGGYIGGPTSPKTADPISLMTLGTAMLASAGGVAVLNKRKHK